MESYVKRILNARVYDVAIETPLNPMPALSQRLGNNILLKREDLQPVFSFKIRGAYNKIVQLSQTEREQGIIAASAGNHAQGVALSARELGIRAVIVMPRTTPDIKVRAVRSHGAQVVLHGDTFPEALAHCHKLMEKHGYTFIHPYDDPDTIAGQGTIGVELLRQHPDPVDAIFLPVGGGGLAAGVGAYIRYIRPEIRLIAVEPDDAACLDAALKANERVILPQVGIFVDGAAVAQIGKETLRLLRHVVDEVITVSTDEVCGAIRDIYDDTRSIAEPAGALSLAGLKKYVEREGARGETLLAIDSGANINFDRLRYISERSELGEKREAILAVTIPERPGSFKAFCKAVGKRNITEFNYRYKSNDEAHIFVGISLNPELGDREQFVESLENAGYPVTDLTDNELAKLHVRHMVGGHAPPEAGPELVYQFEFPERPGALLAFLNTLGARWNISMFHYRNHGSAFGRVVVGFQAGNHDRDRLNGFLDRLGYRFSEETHNPAYSMFLG